MGRSRNLVSVVEAAYTIAEPDEVWLDRLAATVESDLAQGFGSLAYLYDASGSRIRVLKAICRSSPFPIEMATAIAESADEAYIETTWRTMSFGAASSGKGFAELPVVREHLHPKGIRDVLAVNAYDPSGLGVWIGAPQPKESIVTADEARTWSRVGAHLATAFRLKRQPSMVRAAILSPTGSVEHAEGAAKDADARASLRRAVAAMDRARGAMRRSDPEGALGIWRGMVDARWSLVDQFESDGKHYVVAVENEPTANGPEVLAPRERQILTLAALGHTNKLIAYELGLGQSTVRVLLTRAARKLDVATRTELVALYRAHAASEASAKAGA